MQFFSGFSLQNDREFFEAYIKESDFCVCGFSYGAIKAFKEAKRLLKSEERVDTLQLFSPAFFQTKSQKFKRLQLMAYSKNSSSYIEQFLNSCFLPHSLKRVEHSVHTKEELEELLYYEWSVSDLVEMTESGVVIEVYLGGNDAVIDVKGAQEFFKEVATVTYIKDANHFLLTE